MFNHFLLSTHILCFRLGLGDELNQTQKTIQHVENFRKKFGIRTVNCVSVMSPYYGQRDGYKDSHDLDLERYIFIRKETQILRPYVTFSLFVPNMNQVIISQNGEVQKLDIENISQFKNLDSIWYIVKEFLEEEDTLARDVEFYGDCHAKYASRIDEIKTWNLNFWHGLEIELGCELQTKFSCYLNSKKKFLQKIIGYPVKIEEKYTETENLWLYKKNRHKFKIIGEWPPGDPSNEGSTALKTFFASDTLEFPVLQEKVKKEYKYIPYSRTGLELPTLFHLIADARYVISGEGGVQHLCRMFNTPHILLIPQRVEKELYFQNEYLLRIWFVENHWLTKKPGKVVPTAFIFERDLTPERFGKVEELIEFWLRLTIKTSVTLISSSESKQDWKRLMKFIKILCKETSIPLRQVSILGDGATGRN